MSKSAVDVDALLAKIEEQKGEIERLRKDLTASRKETPRSSKNGTEPSIYTAADEPHQRAYTSQRWPLKANEYTRYGRQMILPEIGLKGQLSLRNAAVLIVGAGGLGCPAAAYLAGAGVGTLGLVDGDVVELSNLHRQILHSTERIGRLKVESAAEQLHQLNPEVTYRTYAEHLSPTNALDIFAYYDLVLDCTDHPTSRYLVSDAAVLSRIPLVSGSALRADGQLLVLNNPPSRADAGAIGGPCYRCVFPKPPPVESVISCGEGGILGPVVGVMGVLMAVEAIKLLTSQSPNPPPTNNNPPTANGSAESDLKPAPASMLIYSALSSPPFRSLRMRGARADCAACSAQATITKESLRSNGLDYAAFCGTAQPVALLEPAERLSATQLADALTDREKTNAPATVVVDVRDATRFEICSLPGSVNIPLAVLEDEPTTVQPTTITTTTTFPLTALLSLPASTRIITVCQLGNDSQVAARKLQALGFAQDGQRWVGDLRGGFAAWRREVEPGWPDY